MATVQVRSAPRGRAREEHPIEITKEVITPEMAKKMLENNPNNRPVSRNTVKRYARDMAADRFEFTGDAIRLNGNGELIDGQHRLMAILMANKPVEVLVMRGLDAAIRERLDQGKSRTAGDHLVLRAIDNGIGLAAAARQLIMIKGGEGAARPSNTEILAVVDRHPKLADSVEIIGKPTGIHPSLLAAIHYIGTNLLDDRDSAERFVGVFRSGAPAYEGDPVHLWRERCLTDDNKKSTRLTRSARRVGSIHAWNLQRKNERLQHFRIPVDAAFEGLDTSMI